MKAKKVISTLLLVAMMTTTVGSNVLAGEGEDLTTLSFSYSGATVAADACPRLEEYLADTLGIKMDVWVNADGNTERQNMLVGGEYSDIFIWNIPADFQTAVDGGNVVDLMDYQEQLPSIFENDVYAGAIQYLKDTYGNGEALYALPLRVGDSANVYAGFGSYLRYDLYQKIGAPEITDWDSFLDVLEEMQNAYPEDENGQKNYALSMAGTDIGTLWYSVIEPRGVHDTSKNVLVSYDMSTVKSVFDEDSEVLASLQWMFEANQRGLLDPDGMTQTSQDYQAKVSSGNVLFVPFDWWGCGNYNTDEHLNAEEATGYFPVWPECFIYPASSGNVCGNIRTVAISTKCEDIEAALKYLNWFYSDEGVDIFLNDFEGYLYTTEEDGSRVPTDAYFTGDVAEDGASHGELVCILGNDPAINPEEINENTGTYYGNEKLEAFDDVSKDSKLKTDWIEWNGGYRTTYDKYNGTEQLIQLNAGYNFLPALSSDMESLNGTIDSMMAETAVKMIYAADQAEFDALWEQFKSDAEALGYNDLLAAQQERYAQAVETAEKYTSLVEG